jgi:uncharacterized damage-inducible protein DinB
MSPAIEPLVIELGAEAPATVRALARVPRDQLGWKPHPKSRSLGEIAVHIANVPALAAAIVTRDEFTPLQTPPPPPESVADFAALFESNVARAVELLGSLTEERAAAPWRVVFKGRQVFSRPRTAAIRTNILNHLYHHRGQLSVYLRLLDVPVPMAYGPTADENPFL